MRSTVPVGGGRSPVSLDLATHMSRRRTILFSAGIARAGGITLLVANLPASKRRAESLGCASSVTSICLAAHIWADEHGGFMPTNILCMSDEIGTPKILSCVPARRARTANWADFRPENCTHEILAPGMSVDDTNTAFLRCTIHGHLGYTDTTVFDGVRRRHKFE